MSTYNWAVFMDGKYLGIVESNYTWASKYWSRRAVLTGHVYRLVQIETTKSEESISCL